MANKRMFTMQIVDSDAFLDMPLSAQCLYFHLNMRADDDGFIGNPKRVMKIVGAADDDLKLLILKKFVLMFEGGVIVIKHWRMHNSLSQNRYHETQYMSEKSMLKLKDNKSYSFNEGNPIDDRKMIAAAGRQAANRHNGSEESQNDQNFRDASETQHRRVIDEQMTHSEKDLDLGLGLEKERDIEKRAEVLFAKLWDRYPWKKGWAKISTVQKITLLSVGEKEMMRAIDRYRAEYDKDSDWREPMHGSTFFTTGYIDYLDANYTGKRPTRCGKTKTKRSKKQVLSTVAPPPPYPQRNYNMDQLERILISNNQYYQAEREKEIEQGRDAGIRYPGDGQFAEMDNRPPEQDCTQVTERSGECGP